MLTWLFGQIILIVNIGFALNVIGGCQMLITVTIISVCITWWSIKQLDAYDARIRAVENELERFRRYGTPYIVKNKMP